MTTANPAGAGMRYGTETRDRAVSQEGETKPWFKSTEFFAYIATVLGVLIAAQAVGSVGHRDYFRADQAWGLIVALTIGYMISRGLAKSGSHQTHE